MSIYNKSITWAEQIRREMEHDRNALRSRSNRRLFRRLVGLRRMATLAHVALHGWVGKMKAFTRALLIGSVFLLAVGPGWWAGQAGGSEIRPRTFATPAGTTCDTVRMYVAQLGGINGAIAYGKANGIALTAHQKREALACLGRRSPIKKD